ncbi:unnamed protein product [Spirodela intermedia]|uniref:VOC domain-containing protein n=1 Tax=Spirodela intermedia TaxID=51605 RepID=A0A7I8J9D8_SPIIN|nr:unnamed protein product [Spirodela intermedia]CAA6666385.1 unnamed protein product [Spirodela intermedia]
MKGTSGGVLPLTSLNHISLVCRNVERSLDFYQDVLGFIPIRRPESLKFDGAWLFNYGIGIHLLQSEDPEAMPCECMATVERKLREMGIPCIQRTVEEGGISVDQLFFHDPDGFMIEVCNCDVLPVIPLAGGDPVWVCKRATEPPPQPLPTASPPP